MRCRVSGIETTCDVKMLVNKSTIKTDSDGIRDAETEAEHGRDYVGELLIYSVIYIYATSTSQRVVYAYLVLLYARRRCSIYSHLCCQSVGI